MNNLTTVVNPFYAAQIARKASFRPQQERQSIYAELPRAPINASSVPELTSLYHKSDPGPWGDRRYPGNCSGNLIFDLLRYFQPSNVFDPFSGSGTCQEVCLDLGIPCQAADIRDGFDACNPADYPPDRLFDFIWSHPPYWRQKIYSDSPNDLSQQPTLADFLVRYSQFISNCAGILAPGGKLAILMGDYCDFEAGFTPLVFHTKDLAFKSGLRQACTDIIRFSHGASSSKKVYRSSFIPGLHDVLAIFEKPSTKTGEKP
jgi:hypothetical protein